MKNHLLKLLVLTIVMLSFSAKIQAQKLSVLAVDSVNLFTDTNNHQSVYISITDYTNSYFFSRIKDSLINENKLRINLFFKEYCNTFHDVNYLDTIYQLSSSYPVISNLEIVVFSDTNTIPENHSIPLCMYDTLNPMDTAYYPTSPSKVSFGQTMSRITMYPNPTRETIHVDYPGCLEIRELNLRNIQGMIIKKYPGDIHRLNVADISPGVYFLEFRSTQGCFAKKIIIE
ncbi:MAG: T9SS type A sorting domain-containing protein [Bacteroidota bacterium]